MIAIASLSFVTASISFTVTEAKLFLPLFSDCTGHSLVSRFSRGVGVLVDGKDGQMRGLRLLIRGGKMPRNFLWVPR
jgi:hypothetical protein